MLRQNPVRAFESYLEQAGKALASAAPHQACAFLSKAVSQFEVVLADPSLVSVDAIYGMQLKIRDLSKLASEGERITTDWLEIVAPACQGHRSGGIDIYG
jgi:hypothetical protein